MDSPAFYLLTVLWGEEFRELFLSLCLPSLLAADNIPALENKSGSRFVIVTTDDDWVEMLHHPTFELLKSFIELVHIRMDHPRATDLKMLVMSAGHKAATEYAFAHRAFGVVICPDVIYSSGTIAALQRHANAGIDVVLAIGMRFEREGIVDELNKTGTLCPGRPLSLSPRRLAFLGLENLHSESLLFEWDTDYYWQTPVVTFWRVPGEKGILAHGFSWTPLLINYNSIARHVTDVFENWTMDAHYIHDNFGDSRSIHVVQDSDELLQVSLTSEKVLSYFPLPHDRLKNRPVIGHAVKVQQLRSFVFGHFTDPLRREIFRLPVRIHADSLNGKWSRIESKAKSIIATACAPPGVQENATWAVANLLVPELRPRRARPRRSPRFLWYWHYRRFLWQRMKEKLRLVHGYSRVDDGRDWVGPSFGLMNPVFSVRSILSILGWHWRYRRYLWQRVKEKIGLAQGWSRVDDGHDWVGPSFGLMNPVFSVRATLNIVGWHWRYRRYLWQRVKEKLGLVRGRSRVDDGRDWVSPAPGPMRPVWFLRVGFRKRSPGAYQSAGVSSKALDADADTKEGYL